MSWSYTLPITADLDRVRFYSGENDSTDPQVQDEEITFALSEEGDVLGAAAFVCEHLAAKYARLAAQSNEGLSIQYQQKSQGYATQALALRRKVGRVALPTAGAMFDQDKTDAETDTTRPRPAFKRGDLSNPQTTWPPVSEAEQDRA